MQMDKTPMTQTYAIAIRLNPCPEYGPPVIVLKGGLTIREARERVERLNKRNMPECIALGGDSFVAYNMVAQ